MTSVDTTIMMVTYNRLNLTKQMLECLFKNTKRQFNLVVVDNGSTDGTVKYLEQLGADGTVSRHCLNKENRGIAIGRNQALKITDIQYPDTEWYCTIDNDVEVPDGWLDECIEIMKANPKYGMIGVNMEGNTYPIVTENNKTFQNKQAGNLGTACMVFNKSLHKLLGFFNYLDYGKYGLEDSDMGMRVRVAGLKLGYIKEMGKHFGVGEHDQGAYRQFKTETHNKYLTKFNTNCAAYVRRQKSIYISFKDE